jgi:hypothetical protein
MSLVKANTYQDASGGSNAVFSGVASPPKSMGFRNRIINGDMRIDQRNAGAEVNPAASGTYYLDRWQAASGAASKFKIGRNAGSVTPPAGFVNYLGCTSLSAYSVGAGESFQVRQTIEANNVADWGWGAAGASAVTLSFWVYSSLTGTFGGAIRNATSYNYSYPFSYTVSAANTWELKTVTIAGPTAGTWGTGTSAGLELGFSLGAGSTVSGTAGSWSANNYTSATGATSVVGTNGATFYITGVQLEAGSVASPFERRDYGRELMMCQRYCRAYSSYAMGRARDSDTVFGPGIIFGTTMRATPTLRSGASFIVGGGTAGTPIIITGTGYASSPDIVMVAGSGSSWTSQNMVAFTGIFEAEL